MIKNFSATMSLEIMRFLLSNPVVSGKDSGAIRINGVERLPNGQIFATTIKEWPIDPAARRSA